MHSMGMRRHRTDNVVHSDAVEMTWHPRFLLTAIVRPGKRQTSSRLIHAVFILHPSRPRPS